MSPDQRPRDDQGSSVHSSPAGPSSGQDPRAPDGPSVPPSSSGLAPNLAGALSYVLGIVTGVLFLVIDRDRPFVRFHAVQSIVFSLAYLGLWIGVTVLGLVLEIIPVVGWLVGLLLTVAVGFGGFVLWLYAMYQAFQSREWEMPGLGTLVRRHAVPSRTPPASAGGTGL